MRKQCFVKIVAKGRVCVCIMFVVCVLVVHCVLVCLVCNMCSVCVYCVLCVCVMCSVCVVCAKYVYGVQCVCLRVCLHVLRGSGPRKRYNCWVVTSQGKGPSSLHLLWENGIWGARERNGGKPWIRKKLFPSPSVCWEQSPAQEGQEPLTDFTWCSSSPPGLSGI